MISVLDKDLICRGKSEVNVNITVNASNGQYIRVGPLWYQCKHNFLKFNIFHIRELKITL